MEELENRLSKILDEFHTEESSDGSVMYFTEGECNTLAKYLVSKNVTIDDEPCIRNFNKDDFTDEQFNMLKMMFGMAEQMAYRMGQYPYYDHSFSNTFFELKEKLGVLDLVD